MESAEDQAAAGKRSTAADKDALKALEFNWGEAYIIGRDDSGCWQAARRDCIGHLLTAPGPDELGEAIRADYILKPVPRDLGAADDES